MKIEVLYPEIANLFRDLANIRYISGSITNCEIINTDLKSKPEFLNPSSAVDLVYMGTMTENSQVIAMDHLEPYTEEIRQAIESGTRFLFIGNALELFAKEIIDLDDAPYSREISRFDSASARTKCLGLFDITVTREIMHRLNSLYLGTYSGMDGEPVEIVGFKSVFSYAKANTEIPPLFDTVRGPGLDKSLSGEGIHYKNFMGTYLTGPLMQLNPLFMIKLLKEMGETDVNPPAMEAAMEAYEQRLTEFKNPNLNYIL